MALAQVKWNDGSRNSIMEAIIQWGNGTTTKTTAAKVGGKWYVSGDKAKATTSMGGTIYIHSKGRIYKLSGNRLLFQDFEHSNR